jgi:hypothetical protein
LILFLLFPLLLLINLNYGRMAVSGPGLNRRKSTMAKNMSAVTTVSPIQDAALDSLLITSSDLVLDEPPPLAEDLLLGHGGAHSVSDRVR